MILLQKLEQYGLRGKEFNLIKSFLNDRQQYVFIDGMESEVISSGNSSVCQGSKLSSLLYILYTNENIAIFCILVLVLIVIFIVLFIYGGAKGQFTHNLDYYHL